MSMNYLRSMSRLILGFMQSVCEQENKDIGNRGSLDKQDGKNRLEVVEEI